MLTNTAEYIKGQQLTKDDKSHLEFLAEEHPDLIPYLDDNRESGRKGMLFKLAAAFSREDILSMYTCSKLYKHSRLLPYPGANTAFKEYNVSVSSLNTYLCEGKTYRLYSFDNGLLVFPILKEYGFRRLIFTDDILHINVNSIRTISSASDFLSLLAHLLPEDVYTLQNEMENGTANYSMALAFFEQSKRSIQNEAQYLGAKTALEYALRKKDHDPDWNLHLFFEQLSTEGHHLHPGAKTKTGLLAKDVYRYSPEFHQKQRICFAAIKKEHLLHIEEKEQYLESVFSNVYEQLTKRLSSLGVNPTDYRMLPVHEWQYTHILPDIYSHEIETGSLICLDGLFVEGGASSSFRTIWPVTSCLPALKLSVNSQMTSTIRSISPQTAMNSLKFTKLMRKILKKEPNLQHFLPINEVAGYSFKSNETVKARNLTVVVREPVEELLKEGEVAIAGCSLYSPSPVTNGTILSELVTTYCNNLSCDREEGTIGFLKDYLSIVIPGYLTLLVKYGIALEGHLQNSVPVFKNGQLVRFYFRDWGGVRINSKRLQNQGITLNFHPKSVSITDQEREMYNKAYYTIFQNHLGELVVQLCEYSGLPEKELWKYVRMACDNCFEHLVQDGCKWAENDASELYKPVVEHKALTKMRLYPNEGYCYSSVPNPLYQKDWSEC